MKTRELFFYGGKINNPFKEPLTISASGETNSVIVEEDKIKDLMNANPGVTFWPTNVGATCLMCNGAGSYEDQAGYWDCGTCDGNGEIVADSPEKPMKWIDYELLKWQERTVPVMPRLTSLEILNLGESPIEISKDILSPAREIETPERAVVGYEEPKPIDTIEKKHELKIQNLELAKYHQGKEIENLQARVEQLEGVVGKLEQQIEYVYRNLPKDFDGTR